MRDRLRSRVPSPCLEDGTQAETGTRQTKFDEDPRVFLIASGSFMKRCSTCRLSGCCRACRIDKAD
jgi:hypothetical protein